MSLNLWERYRLRLRRQYFLARAFRKGRELKLISDRINTVRPDGILLFATMRNERLRLPYFLDYYRRLGVDHFLIIDNASDDGTCEYLARQTDVSMWHTARSYKASRFGVDWQNWLLRRHGHGHWVLSVDIDEFFVYPFCDSRPVRALTDWLDAYGIWSFSSMMLDMYPKGEVGAQTYTEGQNPFEIACGFDSGNYMISRNSIYRNLWIQGGPRARAFFADSPEDAPALNKIPLVKWHRSYVYVHSTHMLLPRSLNRVYDTAGGEMASGCLLHAKFLSTFPAKVSEEIDRGEHFARGREYRAYAADNPDRLNLWCKWSETYISWRQLEILGLMSKGSWA
jgi:hypothetical protein